MRKKNTRDDKHQNQALKYFHFFIFLSYFSMSDNELFAEHPSEDSDRLDRLLELIKQKHLRIDYNTIEKDDETITFLLELPNISMTITIELEDFNDL